MMNWKDWSNVTFSERYHLPERSGIYVIVDFIRIDFQGYFTENFAPKNRSYFNPINDYYRNKKVELWLLWSSGQLALSGWWRTEILSLEYTPFMQSWSNENGDKIARPYPDGDKFEAIAASLYPILQQYFQV